MEILVVDDNEINRRLTLLLLSRSGFIGQAVQSGEEALEILNRRHFPIILMDCQMPGLDGYETTRRIRLREAAREGAARARIIAVTADGFPGVRERCLRAGMDAFLPKPLSSEGFREALALHSDEA